MAHYDGFREAADHAWRTAAKLKDAKEGEVEECPLTASGLLMHAASLIDRRGDERDKPNGERSMASTVNAFWAIHGESILREGLMTETQGWEFMEILKMARSAGGRYKADDYEDKIAYAALAAEAAAARRPA